MKEVTQHISKAIAEAINTRLKTADFSDESLVTAADVVLEHPTEMIHGDLSTSIALAYAKQLKVAPTALALDIVTALEVLKNDGTLAGVAHIKVAGPGFINFFLAPAIVTQAVTDTLAKDFGKNQTFQNKKIAYEYTDPNPFKVFHIGHLMTNVIGESLSRLGENAGAEVKRFCYQGDIGRHVALTMYGLRFIEAPIPEETAPLADRVAFFGKAYAIGATLYKEVEDAKEDNPKDTAALEEFELVSTQVRTINKKLYEKSDEELNEIYAKGKEWSLQAFEELYAILGTKFDRYFFESEMVEDGVRFVRENTAPKGAAVFKESENAIIFPGEDYGLHTRVFITRDGLPTYEGKELGLAKQKYAVYPYDLGFTVTANEQNDYFKVVLKVTELLFPEIGTKAKHLSHGMFRLTTGKMGSRTGNVVTGESLLRDMMALALEKMAERDMSAEEKQKVAEQVGVAAIKYTVLRQAIGKDIIFDPQKALSFEGDSGPYLQYATVRARSVLVKAEAAGIKTGAVGADYFAKLEATKEKNDPAQYKLERLLPRFAGVAERAVLENAPQLVANYLMDLAGTFNSFYAATQIIDKDVTVNASPETVYKVLLVSSFAAIMEKGLGLLGITVPVKM